MSRSAIILPELSPTQPALSRGRPAQTARRLNFRQDSAQDEPLDPARRPESQDLIARLSVYTMTSTVMFVFAPLGMALLLFNIVGGENFRTTAHALALTGLGAALDMTAYGHALMSSF